MVIYLPRIGILSIIKGSGSVSSVGLSAGTSGTDVNVIGSPVTGIGSFTLNIPIADATHTGKNILYRLEYFLTISSVLLTLQIFRIFQLRVRSLFAAGIDMVYANGLYSADTSTGGK